MQILVPHTITDGNLIASSVPENDQPVWSSTTTYTVGAKVMMNHHIYEAVQANTGKQPDANPTYWLDLGATNRWRMFDQKIGTATTSPNNTLSVTLGNFNAATNAVALLETKAANAEVIATDAQDGQVYNKTRSFPILPPTAASWWYYFFEAPEKRHHLTFADFPSYRNLTFQITVTGPSAVECGVLLAGRLITFSEGVLTGAETSIQDYSVKDRDAFGNVQIVERAFSKKSSWEFRFHKSRVDVLLKLLASLRAKPALYIGSTLYDTFFVYGFYKDFDIIIDGPRLSLCKLELEGLI